MMDRRRALMAAQGGDAPVYEHGTWEDLFQKIDAGTYATDYSVGEILPLTISGTDYQAQIVAFNADTLAGDGVTDKAAVSLVAVKLLNDYKRSNPAYQSGVEGTGAIGGWPKSEIRTWMNSTLIGNIPDIIKSRIVSVKKYSRITNTSGSSVNNVLSEDKLWMPSAREMFGNTESSGPTYTSVFSSNDARKKYRYTSIRRYWTRSAAANNYPGSYSTVNTPGSVNTQASEDTSTGVCVGFCVG